MVQLLSLSINLNHIADGLELIIDEKFENTLFDCKDADANGEARCQLVEGFSYDYELNDHSYALAKDQIVQPHSRKKYLGTISPNIFVGTLTVPF